MRSSVVIVLGFVGLSVVAVMSLSAPPPPARQAIITVTVPWMEREFTTSEYIFYDGAIRFTDSNTKEQVAVGGNFCAIRSEVKQ